MSKTDYVEKLLDKALAASCGPEAQTFAQAACNAANALRVLVDIAERGGRPPTK